MKIARLLRYIPIIALLLSAPVAYSNNVVAEIPDTLARQVELNEVVVKPGKERYSKRNNPAVDFMKRIREASDLTDPHRQPHYNYEKYERLTIGFDNADDTTKIANDLINKLPFLWQYVDTNEVTGRVILPLSVKEKVSNVYSQADPSRTREFVTAIKRDGMDEIIDHESMQVYLEDMLRDVDLYKDDVTLMSNRFVSPLSKIGPDFYKYYLTDTIAIGQDSCIELSFAPRNNAMMGFVGRLYVPKNDSTMFVKRVTMSLSHNVNVNFIESLNINQEFERDSMGLRLKTLDDLSLVLALVRNTQGVYAQKYTRYDNHNFDPADRPELFERLGETYVAADAYLKDDQYWRSQRDQTYHKAHGEVASMLTDLREVPLYYWGEKILKWIVTGYIPIPPGEKFEYGPLNTTVSFSDVEGARFRFGGMTTANLSKHWFVRAYGAYGLKDHRWKYYGEVEYSFNEKRRHTREFPMRSIRASYRYDVDAIGQDYAFTNADNIFISLKRMSDTLMIYRHDARLDYIWELDNHLSWQLTLQRERKEASRYVNFNLADGTQLNNLDFSKATFSLRYALGEKFIQTRDSRIPVNQDNYTLCLTQTYGAPNFLGSSRYTVNKTELDMRKRFWFSAFGYLDAMIKGGYVWSTVPFTELFSPNANLTYTIQPESFALLNPFEFITDSYVAFDFTYWANGALFNYIPLLKKLRWREIVSFRSYWGHLSDKNNPAFNPQLPLFPNGANQYKVDKTPYMEMGVGIDNIFKILRVDYVWRLTYRSTPGVSRHGVRVALHFNF